MRHKKNKFLSSLKHFWEQILKQPFGRRLIFFASSTVIIFLFFPWFSEGQNSMNAFGKFPVFGGSIFLIALFSLLLILREMFSQKGFLGNIAHGNIFIFLFGQGLYTVILANFTLHELLQEKSDYAVNIGAMITFVALGIGLAGSIFSKGFIPKEEERKVFADIKDIDVSKVNMQPEKQLSLGEYDEK